MFAIARRALEETCILSHEKTRVYYFSIDYGKYIDNLSTTFVLHVGHETHLNEQAVQQTACLHGRKAIAIFLSKQTMHVGSPF